MIFLWLKKDLTRVPSKLHVNVMTMTHGHVSATRVAIKGNLYNVKRQYISPGIHYHVIQYVRSARNLNRSPKGDQKCSPCTA